ncbi:MAG: DUF427 domain-containing protein [Planctomycetota bacterium]
MVQRDPVGPGQESVWDYPRPPALELVHEQVRIEIDGREIARSTQALRVLETSHPPTIYIPPADIDMRTLVAAPGGSFCEWKGRAAYWSYQTPTRQIESIAWSYASPTARFVDLAGFLAFYPSKVDAAWVGDDKVMPQAGDFYGGWITSKIVGPFKGGPGTMGW